MWKYFVWNTTLVCHVLSVSSVCLVIHFQGYGTKHSICSRKHYAVFCHLPPTSVSPVSPVLVSCFRPNVEGVLCVQLDSSVPCPALNSCGFSTFANFQKPPLPDAEFHSLVFKLNLWSEGSGSYCCWTGVLLSGFYCCHKISLSLFLQIKWTNLPAPLRYIIFEEKKRFSSSLRIGRWESVSTSVPTVGTKRWREFAKSDQKKKNRSSFSLENVCDILSDGHGFVILSDGVNIIHSFDTPAPAR